jgi:tetratricopeptide (TPR) repeat protein
MWAECVGPAPAAAVVGCTRLIDAGNLSTEEAARAHEARGEMRGRLGQFPDAIADFTRALALDADRPFSYYLRAGVYMQTREFEKAIADLERASELEPGSPAHPRGLASALTATGDFKGAIAAADRAIELAPDYSPAFAQRGVAKAAARDPKGALEDLDRAITMDPRAVTFFVDRGRVKSDLGDYFGAIQDFERAMAIAPTRGFGVADLGLVKMRMRNYAGAVADFEKVLALSPRNYAVMAALSDARAFSGDLEGALRECAAERLKAAAFAPLYRTCAGHLGRAGRTDDALAAYAKAIEIEPKNAGNYHSRGIFKSDRQDFAGALADLRSALALDGSRDYTHVRIFLLEARLGNRAAATIALRDTIIRRTAANADPWVMKIAAFLAGTMTEQALLDAADHDVPIKAGDRRCEAYFYSGWMHLVDGDVAGARTRFEQSLATEAIMMLEYRSAAAELEVLRKK